jgi:hypothetical protein
MIRPDGLMTLHFTQTESTFNYFEALSKYLAAHGKPVAFYSDKASVFYVKQRSQKAGKGVTQFRRARTSSMSRRSARTRARPKAAWSAPT